MSKVSVGLKVVNDDAFYMDMEEEEFMIRAGKMGGCYEYGKIIEIHFDKGYLKRDRLTGEVLKATLYVI